MTRLGRDVWLGVRYCFFFFLGGGSLFLLFFVCVYKGPSGPNSGRGGIYVCDTCVWTCIYVCVLASHFGLRYVEPDVSNTVTPAVCARALLRVNAREAATAAGIPFEVGIKS